MDCPVFLEGSEVGRVKGKRRGNRMEWQASCPFAEGWIYRMYLQKKSTGESVCLGVMMPEGDLFRLHKQMDKGRMGGLWDCDDLCGIILCSRPGERAPVLEARPIQEPCLDPLPFPMAALEPVLAGDGYIDTVFSSCGGQKMQWEGIDYYLAPGKPGEVLGPVAFFCLLTWIPWGESGWWVLCVGPDGQPFALRE